MPNFIKVIHCEKPIKLLLAGIIVPIKFCNFLFLMHGVLVTNILFLGLTSGCSTKKILTKLKDLQPSPPVDTNKSSETINYPLQAQDDIIFNNNHSLETFIIILLIVISFCFINSEYPSKVLNFLKRK